MAVQVVASELRREVEKVRSHAAAPARVLIVGVDIGVWALVNLMMKVTIALVLNLGVLALAVVAVREGLRALGQG